MERLSFDLSGRIALVTGASSGLGRHFATVLACHGAEVILTARRTAQLEETADAIHAAGGACRTVTLDVADGNSIAACIAQSGPIDIVVNNAGVVRDAPALEQTESDWDAVLDTNLKGMFLLAQAAAKAMIAQGEGGSIINIASILGLRQAGGVLPYAVSKAGVIQLTKVMALEFARYGIRVNAIAPGYFDTDLNRPFWETEAGKTMLRRIPQRRLGQLSDLDGPLLLLATGVSGYMTGSTLTVDGGHLVSSL